jgi:murein DD-endopeptidase MepM/ murein hydrolase activator NlpD
MAVAVAYRRRLAVYRRAVAAARPVDDHRWLALAERWRRRLGVRRPVALLSGEPAGGPAASRRLGPFTVGVVRPAIWLPEALLAPTGGADAPAGPGPAVVEAVIAHEMAHVRRLDALWLGLQHAVRALWFFNPLVWYSAARLDEARERVADELVLVTGELSPRDYAASLLAVLRLDLAAAGRRGALPVAPGLGNPQRRFAMRIREILDRPPAARRTLLPPAALCAALALFLLPMAAGGDAGDKAPPPPAVPELPSLTPEPAAVPLPPPIAAIPEPGALPPPPEATADAPELPAIPAVAPIAALPPTPATAATPATAPAPPSVPASEASPAPETVPTPEASPAPESDPTSETHPTPAPAAGPVPAAAPRAVPAPAPVPVPAAMASPVPEAELTSGFGARRDPKDGRGRPHRGVDLAAPRGTPVLAPAAGRVAMAAESWGEDGRYGRTVLVDHGEGYQTVYTHLDAILVAEGDQVEAGSTLGRVGTSGWVTGPHLHFEVLRDGEPVDPASVIPTLAK